MDINPYLFLPELFCLGFFLFLLITDLLNPKATCQSFFNLSIAACFITSGLVLYGLHQPDGLMFADLYQKDALGSFFKFIFTVAFLFILHISSLVFPAGTRHAKTFCLTLWISLISLFFLVSVQEFITLFISLEIFTLSLYILVAFQKHQKPAIEASIKYLIFGSAASAFLVFGMALLYVAAGTLDFYELQRVLSPILLTPLVITAFIFILSGVAFKMGIVPFHAWVPDVYQGASLPITAYLSTVSKAAGFFIFFQMIRSLFPSFSESQIFISLFIPCAVLSLIIGNFGALSQNSLKRLLAYSGISHSGFLILSFLSPDKSLNSVIFFYYLIAYILSSLAVFLGAALVEKSSSHFLGDSLDSYFGLAKRSAWATSLITVGLLSLAGIPPLVGFFGKFFLFISLAKQPVFFGLLGISLFTAFISLIYYFGILRRIYFEEPSSNVSVITVGLLTKVLSVLLFVLIWFFGFYPKPLIEYFFHV